MRESPFFVLCLFPSGKIGVKTGLLLFEIPDRIFYLFGCFITFLNLQRFLCWKQHKKIALKLSSMIGQRSLGKRLSELEIAYYSIAIIIYNCPAKAVKLSFSLVWLVYLVIYSSRRRSDGERNTCRCEKCNWGGNNNLLKNDLIPRSLKLQIQIKVR